MMREHPDHVERWGICEIALDARCPGNPFQDVDFEAEFTHAAASLTVAGFFDGGDVFRVRCMPEHEGLWNWRTRSDHPELNGHAGVFTCTPAGPGNHGPVRVAGDHDFAYADGTWYSAIGTTSYGWIHEAEDRVECSLAGILAGPFNKLRMLILPKVYDRWCNDPRDFVFPRADDGWDLERFDPAFFRRLEGHLATLRDHGIEADLILFHPYDRWGFRELPSAVDERYLRYCVARLAAFRNVWWSLPTSTN